MRALAAIATAILCAAPALATAQGAPPAAPSASTALRDANVAAAAGDWARVEALTAPLVAQQLPTQAERAEALRLAGVAAFFHQRLGDADALLFAWLRLDLDGQLDPAIYPPEAIGFLANVRQQHAQQLRALRPKPKGSVWLNLLPPAGQFQNGERTKGIVLGAVLGVSLAANVTSAILLSSWCTHVAGDAGSSRVCDDHYSSATTLRTVNVAAGIALIATYVYGVYDGVSHYRRRMREAQWMPYVTGNGAGVFARF